MFEGGYYGMARKGSAQDLNHSSGLIDIFAPLTPSKLKQQSSERNLIDTKPSYFDQKIELYQGPSHLLKRYGSPQPERQSQWESVKKVPDTVKKFMIPSTADSGKSPAFGYSSRFAKQTFGSSPKDSSIEDISNNSVTPLEKEKYKDSEIEAKGKRLNLIWKQLQDSIKTLSRSASSSLSYSANREISEIQQLIPECLEFLYSLMKERADARKKYSSLCEELVSAKKRVGSLQGDNQRLESLQSAQESTLAKMKEDLEKTKFEENSLRRALNKKQTDIREIELKAKELDDQFTRQGYETESLKTELMKMRQIQEKIGQEHYEQISEITKKMNEFKEDNKKLSAILDKQQRENLKKDEAQRLFTEETDRNKKLGKEQDATKKRLDHVTDQLDKKADELEKTKKRVAELNNCLLYTSDAADDTPCVDLGGRRIIKKKKTKKKEEESALIKTKERRGIRKSDK
eukprot:TRINITY_DN5437_c0_g1_i3.p1 TRINITY_DN5437_c0_g1~~TRINITY_DN5437_c0_g1_i3.p1  ORF type:complete len:470 (-),score=110.73 TRINITY_DN5437_c0_g1_i3:45-1424(-)